MSCIASSRARRWHSRVGAIAFFVGSGAIPRGRRRAGACPPDISEMNGVGPRLGTHIAPSSFRGQRWLRGLFASERALPWLDGPVAGFVDDREGIPADLGSSRTHSGRISTLGSSPTRPSRVSMEPGPVVAASRSGPSAPWCSRPPPADGLPMVAGRREPVPPDPAASRLTVEPATPRAVVESVLLTAPVSDDHPLPVLDAPHPRLARVLAWVVPWWAARRAAARVARHLHALWARVTAAHDARGCARDPEHLASPVGPAWRRSRYWKR
jgi:hypothetical protein